MSDPSASLIDPFEFLPLGWRRLCLTLEWDGTLFNGWQVQAKGERTIQGCSRRRCNPWVTRIVPSRRSYRCRCSRAGDAGTCQCRFSDS
ncbi:MAG: hypothetical protein HC933_08795, partial [Pleurocapsa sp. SU_196_0]|nr:hypothetical protein [Pleurocapsa sp. SU_196_0]